MDEQTLVSPKTTVSDGSISNLLVIGAGYVGAPTAAVFAKYCPSLDVYVADIDANRISAWNSQTYANSHTFPPYFAVIEQMIIPVFRFLNLDLTRLFDKYATKTYFSRLWLPSECEKPISFLSP